jgi:3-isopropylmalate/(R)-2-methylmalate dehydratase small subunit
VEPLITLKSKIIPLPYQDVDTDQIIPARYLKGTEREGLADGLFASWRYQSDGSLEPEFILNRAEYLDARIMITGNNFGCGSSREHAVWALMEWGIRVIISTSFADIFRNNALKNGLLPIVLDINILDRLFQLVAKNPETQLLVDLPSELIILSKNDQIGFTIDPFNKQCLIEGIDQLGYLLKIEEQIDRYEKTMGK